VSPPRAETFELFKKIFGAYLEDVKRGDLDNRASKAVLDQERTRYTDEEWEQLCQDVWSLEDVKALLEAIPGMGIEVAAHYIWSGIKATRYQMEHYPIKKRG